MDCEGGVGRGRSAGVADRRTAERLGREAGRTSQLDPVVASLLKKRKDDQQRVRIPRVGLLFITLVSLESCFLVALSLAGMAKTADEDDAGLAKQVRYYDVLSVFVVVGFFYFSLDAIIQENIFQFWSSNVTHVLIVVFVLWHFHTQTMGSFYHSVSLPLVIVVLVFQVAYVALFIPIERDFGYLLYRRIGGNVNMRLLYKVTSVFNSLLKLDVFLIMLLVVMSGFFLYGMSAQTIINLVALGLTIGWASVGWLAVRRERKGLMYVFFSCALLAPLYIVYKLVEMKEHPDNFSEDVTFGQFLVTGSIACIVRVLLIGYGVWSTNNFGRGLKEHYFDKLLDPSSVAGGSSTASAGPVHNPVVGSDENGNTVNVNNSDLGERLLHEQPDV